jgi:hypothetical protein
MVTYYRVKAVLFILDTTLSLLICGDSCKNFDYNIVMDLINALPGNSSVNTVQHTTKGGGLCFSFPM